jgi:transposase
VSTPWPLAPNISDAVLGERLFANSGTKQCHRRHAEPDWSEIHRELRRNHVTLSILWDEYIERHPTGYRYSRFCDLYREWERRLPVTMRQTHAASSLKKIELTRPRMTPIFFPLQHLTKGGGESFTRV